MSDHKPTLSERIEDRIDKVVMAGTDVDMDLGGVQFKTMIEVMDFAKLMSVSDLAVPPHLRNNPGACLAICTKALRNRFDPFALAEHSFAMEKEESVTVLAKDAQGNLTGGRSTQKEKVKIIAYDSAVIRAIIEAHAPVIGGLNYRWEGEGDERVCIVSAKMRATGEIKELKSVPIGKRKADIGLNESGKVKGSPLWQTKPDQQQGYDTGRDWCRLYSPQTLLGWYDKDEFDETPRNITPKTTAVPSVGSRLKKDDKPVGAGFAHDNVAKALEHNPGRTLDASMKPREAEPVTVQAQEKPLEETRQLALAGDVETELEAKKRAMDNCTTKADLKELVEVTTDYLKETGRTDLLSDFLTAAVKREKKLKV